MSTTPTVCTPLLVPFAVTRRRIVGLWVRVGGYAPVDERLAARAVSPRPPAPSSD